MYSAMLFLRPIVGRGLLAIQSPSPVGPFFLPIQGLSPVSPFFLPIQGLSPVKPLEPPKPATSARLVPSVLTFFAVIL